MTTELSVKYKWQDQELTLTKSDVRNLISTSPNVTDKEIVLFMKLCQYQQLNPFIREAYLIKYGTTPASLVTGVEVFTKRAENSPDFDGIIRTNNYSDTDDRNKWWSQVDVHRKNLAKPITTRVYYEEYVGTDKYGKVTKMWRNKARTMLDKVALMQGLRLAFPTALGGLYEENELDQQTTPKDVDSEVKVKEDNEIKNMEKATEEAEIIEGEIIEEEEEKPMQMTEQQDMYIKAILINDILTKKEKEALKKAMLGGTTKKFADEIIEQYKKVKAKRTDEGQTHDYVSMILFQKKKLFIPAPMITEWAGVKKLDDLNDLPTAKLEEVLELAKKYEKTS